MSLPFEERTAVMREAWAYMGDLVARKRAARHGGMMVRTELTDRIEQEDKPLDDLVAMDAALNALRLIDPDLCVIVEWHYFVGLSIPEIAELRKISERTAKRHLAMARAFLHDFIKGELPSKA